ncbi:MAG: phosphoribosyltransferase family protein [Oscillospiraceae bacterium]
MLTYEMDIAGLKRELPLCRLADDVYIGAFVIFGDVELTVHCAAEMLKIAPEYDYIIAPEAKSIPLLYEMARQSGENKYFLARKSPKLYMTGVFEVEVKSTTTEKTQRIVLDTADAEQMRGKRILIIDDVISTGESLKAVEDLVLKAGGIVAGRVFVLAEGDAQKRDDILYLAPLPLFDKNGNPKV